ncbi:MAG: N-acetylneuraminate synthase family protein [Bacteroidales bacterium]|nr:N-acetylneuraminate synthase family protein [Bacteroidales bacterium]
MKKTYIIAEMAWSYTGSFETAIRILRSVKEAGADAIGIHLTNMETYMTRDYRCLAGQTLSARGDDQGDAEDVYGYLDKINMKNEEWIRFGEEASRLDIDVVAMCNDFESFLFSKQMPVKKYVIAASLFYEFDFIREIIRYNNNVIIRIGGANLKEIDGIVSFILGVDPASQINLLAGIQLYPTPIDQLQIGSIPAIQERYLGKNVTVGLADHIDGDHPYAIYLPALALSFGIDTIEKHITTDRKEKLEDYEAALGGHAFREFVTFIRTAETALGDGSLDYLVNPQNEKYRLVLRKRIVAARPIPAGTVISREHVAFKRNDFGLELEYLEEVIGRKAIRHIEVDEGIRKEDVA